MDYLICANGAVVYDTIDGMLRERLIPRERALAVMDAVEPLGAGWNAFVDGKSYFEWRSLSYLVTGRRQPLGGSDRLSGSDMRHALHTGAALHTKATMLRLRRAARFAKRIVQHDDSMRQVFDIRPYIEVAEGGLLKMGCSLPSAKACERAIDILEHMGDFEIARMSTTELEITAKGATKGNAATWLMERLGIEPACAVAFGDSENDATLAEVCGTFVAMGNADRRVRELADDVCETVYDDGVARWLERAMAEADGASNV
jgi:hydroxymethylpyrimidine pyrophosphatase-like HAD family hydrolase